ncbi:MAG: hypothetical protein ACK4GO_18105 [Gemmobacter sp.]
MSFAPTPLPIVEHFRRMGECVEIDTRRDRPTVHGLLRDQMADQTDPAHIARMPHEAAGILLGLRPYPRRV